jgi:murein DD-endopeptidase MepM/ murein hydrolase activator NlpD
MWAVLHPKTFILEITEENFYGEVAGDGDGGGGDGDGDSSSDETTEAGQLRVIIYLRTHSLEEMFDVLDFAREQVDNALLWSGASPLHELHPQLLAYLGQNWLDTLTLAELEEMLASLPDTINGISRLSSPFDTNWLPNISSHFGQRINPITNRHEFHRGIDIALPAGTTILAVHDGIVTFSGYSTGGFGNLVIIEREDGLITKNAHCDTLLVSVGQAVTAGTPIATVGSTGASTGPHLHLEVLLDEQNLNPLMLVNHRP